MIFVGYDGHDYVGRGRHETVGDVFGTLTEEQKDLFHEYIGEITDGYLKDETRKAYAKMALSELNRDQLKVLAWLEMKILEEKKGKSDE